MASTSGVANSFNDLNVFGEVLMTGAGKNTGQFLAAIGGLNQARIVDGMVHFPMGATTSLDAGSQAAISEDAGVAGGTSTFYNKTQEINICQYMKQTFHVSHLRESNYNQIDSSLISVGMTAPKVSEFDRQAAAKQAQIATDWEYSMLNGTFANRVNSATATRMRGLKEAIVTNSVNASSAALSKTLMDDLLVMMIESGTPFERVVLVARPGYLPKITNIYGYQPEDWNLGGVAVKNIMTDFGNVGIIWTTNAPANTLLAVDLAHCVPVISPILGQNILQREFMDGGSAKKGYIECNVSIDYGTEKYHGELINLA